ncbi:MAG: hypothetical protein E6753_03760 [Streptococcus mitis]|uniref:hypothetical protein n=1 Tax=Streptococcus mitis TaxID=28037 RepID=UPI0029046725|nr:hypothetical protein [Streptococcus mitis]
MDNKIKVEEKLKREEIDFLKINLETCFNVIVKSNGVGEFDIKNDDKDKFLETFSPWHKKEGKELIEKFVGIVNNTYSPDDFSWLDILDTDKQWMEPDDEETKKEIKNKSKHVNMRYQIPTHFHGDIDKAVLFYCMENPRGYINDSEMDRWVKDQMSGKLTMNDYYKQTAELRDEPWKDKTIKKIIEERYQLNDVTTDSIEKIIYSDAKEVTPLRRELQNMFRENKEFFEKTYILMKNKKSKKPVLSDKYYYISRFYAQLLEINGGNLSKYNASEYKEEAKAEQAKAFKISEKICNLEIYPFSSSDPKLKGIGKTILLNSDLSRLSAYIILRRIYRYLNSPKENPKPIIVLRKYASAWEQLFVEIFKEVKEKDQSFDNRLVLSLLEKGFFYCQTGQQGGGITTGNVISVLNFKTIDKKDSKLFDDTKMKDFNSIKSLLTNVKL